MACLDENTVARLVEQALDAEHQAEAHAHLATCAVCREVVAQLLATPTASRPAASLGPAVEPAPALLVKGATLGRYRIDDVHGVGGMGVVYSATDTTLNRKVALKLLRSSVAAPDRLLSEARALARLSHPGVVAVHDVGLEGGQLYLAMEWVEGQTLKLWLQAAPRSAADVLDVFTAAGRALSAIHAAGLVHRDFKPENVLVGADGRVRVADLGLAFEADSDRAPPVGTSGTPAYMAPERRRGERSGPEQDQYSFCVALVEALTGRRPRAEDRAQLAALPRAFHEPLSRGLALDPGQRHPSMDALLEALQRARRAPARRAASIAAAVLLTGALGAVGWRATHDDCRSIASQLDGVWDVQRRAGLKAALSPLGDKGPATAERALQRLDARAADWRAAKELSCQRSGADDLTVQLTRQCLLDRRQELRVLVDVLQQAKDQAFVAKATDAIDLMLKPAACPQQAAMRRRLPPPPDSEQPALVEVHEGLAAGRALALGGDYPHALERIQAALSRARASTYPTLELEALADLARVEDQAGRLDDAVRDWSAAGYAAEAQGNDEIAATAWCSLVLVAGYRQGKVEMARHFAQLGKAALERAGDAPAWEVCLRQNTALLAIREGHHGEAVREMKIAVDKAVVAWGADDPNTVRALGILGSALGELGRNGEALDARLRALEGTERLKGPAHADTAVAHVRAAESLLALGRHAEALEHATLAVDRQLALTGPRHFRYGIALCIRGSIRSEQGDHRSALADLEAGVAAVRAQQPPDSIFLAQPLVALAEGQLNAGRAADAIANGGQAVALLDKKLEAPTPQTAYGLVVLGRARFLAGDAPGALKDLERAVEIYRRAGEDVDPSHVRRAVEALEAVRRR